MPHPSRQSGFGSRAAQPLFVSYEVACDEAWHTRYAQILQVNAGERRELKIEVAGAAWTVNGKLAPELQGCIDIDLSVSTSTNTLPLRRLKLQRGHSQAVTAAWVRFPTLEIATLQQTYKRLDDTRYFYESATGFTAEIRVDAYSVVFDYPGVWTRVAQRNGQWSVPSSQLVELLQPRTEGQQRIPFQFEGLRLIY